MNVLFWADGFWPRIGGTETQGLQFVEEMQRRGHRCLVVSQRDHEGMREEETFIRRFPFQTLMDHRARDSMRPIKEGLERIAREFSPDIVYLNTLGNGSALAFLLFQNLFPCPSIATIHAPYFGETLPPLVSTLCSRIDHICCASEWGYKTMAKLLPQPLKLIHYGLSLPTLAPTPLPFSPPTLLLLGRLSSEKGFEVGIEAFSLLKARGSDARLLIAGEGGERPFLEHLARKLGDSVQFLGGVSRRGDAVSSVINRATLVAMPSHFEAFGLVALESMRLGRPVIASNVGGLPEIVSHSDRGLLVPPGDPAALASAFEELLSHPDKTRLMGERARTWATRHHLLQDNVDRYEALFHECLRGAPCPR